MVNIQRPLFDIQQANTGARNTAGQAQQLAIVLIGLADKGQLYRLLAGGVEVLAIARRS